MQYLGGRLRVLVVAGHHAGALHGQLADLALLDVVALLVDDLGLPAVAGHADGADLLDVLHAQVHASGADGLGQAVVGVVLVVRELLLPALDEAARHRLRADVHQPPGGQVVVVQVDLAPVDGVQDVLGPRHQQPHDGAVLLGGGLYDGQRLHALEQHAPAAHQERAEPVHLRAGVIQRRDAQEHVVVGLAVVSLLGAGGVHQALVVVQDGLGEARGAGGEVDGRVVGVGQLHVRGVAGLVRRQVQIILGKGRAVVAHVEQQLHAGDLVDDLLHAADELRPEEQCVHVGQLRAVADLVGGIAIVHRHGQRACLEDAEVHRQPLQAVHQQHGNLVALFDAPAEQQVGTAVRLFVEHAPADLAPELVGGAALDQLVLLPGHAPVLAHLRVQLHQGDLASVQLGVLFQDLGNWHGESASKSCKIEC